MSNIVPLGARVLVLQDEVEVVTPNGLIVPASAAEKPTSGTVVAVGKDQKDVAPGDNVVYTPYAGTAVSHEGEDYILLDSSEVIAILP
jgi:chaperonin GroES